MQHGDWANLCSPAGIQITAGPIYQIGSRKPQVAISYQCRANRFIRAFPLTVGGFRLLSVELGQQLASNSVKIKRLNARDFSTVVPCMFYLRWIELQLSGAIV